MIQADYTLWLITQDYLQTRSLSDTIGRSAILKITPILITIPTLFLAFLPTYHQIGIVAPLILILLRIFQGICIGGEYSNNIIYLCETAKPSNRYFIGSLGSCTGSLGIFIASTTAATLYLIMPEKELSLWGWRLAFAASFFIGVLTYLMRKHMNETQVFKHLSSNNLTIKNPVTQSFKNEWKKYLTAIGLAFLPATAFYYVFMFLPNFLNTSLEYNASKILGDNSLSLLARLLIIPILGLAADRIGGIKIARIAAILFLLLSYPIFLGITHHPQLIPFLAFTLALLTTLNAATTPGLLVDYLSPNTRGTMLSFTFNFCFGIFGGIVPIICLFLANKTGYNTAPAYYLIFAALITFIATFFFEKDNFRHE